MSLNVERSVRQQLIENPQMLNDRDERGWTLLHREALAGNRNIVRLLLELGADHTVRTPEGHTALDLARLLDWSATVEILSGHQREPS